MARRQTNAPHNAANARAQKRLKEWPCAVGARYDKRMGRVAVDLDNGILIAFDPRKAQGLEMATSGELSGIVISPSGLGLHFPKLDADIYLPALLEGVFGSRKWMASRLGAFGGQRRSRAKAQAARANGKLGGRPRKSQNAVA